VKSREGDGRGHPSGRTALPMSPLGSLLAVAAGVIAAAAAPTRNWLPLRRLGARGVDGAAPQPLPPGTPQHSVSGFSGGASMALNHLVAFSDLVLGIGIIGGSPYGCTTVPASGYSCSGFEVATHLENKSIPWDAWVDKIDGGYLAKRAANQLVAPLSLLKGKPVYLFSGTDDVRWWCWWCWWRWWRWWCWCWWWCWWWCWRCWC